MLTKIPIKTHKIDSFNKYDEEWRLIAKCKMNLPAMIECVPAGVIIGLIISPVDKNLIISMAKEIRYNKLRKFR